MQNTNKTLSRFIAISLAILLSIPSMHSKVFATSTSKEILPTGADVLLPYLNTSYSDEERAADLVSRMTMEEKATQLQARTAEAIPRLNVRKYDWWSEALHGVARDGRATSFTTGLGIAATWNRDLIEDMMVATSNEARAKTNDYGKGLSYWSPTINMARDPRWGRAEETYGEDPFLAAEIGGSFTRGLQGTNENYLKAIATIKHFAANNSEVDRHDGSADMDDRTLREYYTYAFKAIVEQENVASVMTAYNAINGTPASVNPYLLDDLLRRTWGFDGYVVTDCGALRDIFNRHHWKPEGWIGEFGPKETTAFALKAGTDLNCGGVYKPNVIPAIEAGLVTEDDVDIALVRLFTARMATGEFDPKGSTPWDEYTEKPTGGSNRMVCAENHTAEECWLSHTKVAEESSDEAVVLLQNEPVAQEQKNILPLDASENNKIVIVGELGNSVVLGDYSTYEARHTSTPLQGITKQLQEKNPSATVEHIPGVAGDSGAGNYLMNFKEIRLYRSNDVVDVLHVKDNDGLSGCRMEGESNVGYVQRSGAYVKFSNVDMDNIVAISAVLAGTSNETRHTRIEIRTASPTNGQVASQMNPSNTNGWGDYQETKAEYNDGGYDGKQDLYVVMNEAISVGLSSEDEQKIKDADTVIAYVGTKESDSMEEMDRNSIALPRAQADIVNKVAELNPRTVVYIQAVGQVSVEEFKDNVPAILWCTYNGQAQGNTVGRILFGEVNPSAKLPFTWYSDINQLDNITTYTIRSSDISRGRTYQYFTGDTTYPFGYGLSYTNFTYSNLQLSANQVSPDDSMDISFDIKNTGLVTGKEVPQVYIVSPGADRVNRPAKRLKGFDKIELDPGASKTVNTTIPISDLYFWDEVGMVQTFDQGIYNVEVGNLSCYTKVVTAKQK